MLANLAVRALDEAVTAIADRRGLIYTRYADDLTLSTRDPAFTRKLASKAIGEIYAVMGRVGLSPNVTKTRVAPPGARKVVLGLLVDGQTPRLTRDFKASLRQHLYYLRRKEFGPARHALRRRFVAISGLRHHIRGLIAFAGQIEPEYGRRCLREFAEIDWPA
jgi:RNA-directed DNA polymerase